MSKHRETEQLLTAVVRLSRVQRRLPDDEDVIAVSAALRDRLGASVRRSVAARLLGISEPTVQRRIESGDLPVVLTTDLKFEVPVTALVQLLGEVDEYRSEHPYDQQPVAAVFAERRDRARQEGERLERQLERWHVDPDVDPHQRAQVRNRAMHWLLARKLDRALVGRARQRLQAWEEREAIHPTYAQRWHEVLSRTVPEIREAIVADTLEGRDLRQNSPFAGELLERERLEVLQLVR